MLNLSQNDYETPEVFEPLYTRDEYRYKVVYGGRGGAKSWAIADALLTLGYENTLRIVCTREIQKSIKDSVHRLLKDRIKATGLQDFYTALETEIRGANGTLFLFGGLKHNPDTIKSLEGADIAWVEEANTVTDNSWKILIPTIRKKGSEIWVSFNPAKKQDAAYQRFVVRKPTKSWVKQVSWRDNPWFPDVLMQEMLDLKRDDYEDYLHVWEGQLKQIADGAIFGKQIIQARKDNRICSVPIESMANTYTFWDLGRNDHTAIWFMQNVGKEYRFIDYYENRLQDLEHYVKVIKDKDYLYAQHFLPHDAEQKILGFGNKTRVQMLEEVGVKPIHVVPRVATVNEGIEMTRKVFSQCWFDEKRCERGIEALSQYHYEYKDDDDVYRQTPKHDWASNGADAFRQFAQGYTETIEHDEEPEEYENWMTA